MAFHIIKDGVVYQLEPDSAGGWVITIPALPGCTSGGGTIDEALEMVVEARELWLDVAREKGFPIPQQFEALPSTP